MSAVGPVLAADIPAAPIVKAPVVVAPSQSWYGFYIGVNGGYAWGRNGVDVLPDAFYTPLFNVAGVPRSLAGDPRGFIGGITYGSNYQFDRLVIGFDSDWTFSDIKSTQTFAGIVAGVPFIANASQKLSWFNTTRLRGGILLSDNWLLYATGGLAGGRAETSASAAVTLPGACLVPGTCPLGTISKNSLGLGARRRPRIRQRSVAVPRRISALRSRHGELPHCRSAAAGRRDRGLDQVLRRHGARRHHLPLQLDPARPDLRQRPHVVHSIRVPTKKQPAQGPAVSIQEGASRSALLSVRQAALAAAGLRSAIGGRLRLRLIARRNEHRREGGHRESKQRSDKQSSNHWAFPLVKCGTGESSSTKTVK